MKTMREMVGLLFEDFDHRSDPTPVPAPPPAGPDESVIGAAFRSAAAAAAMARHTARVEATQAALSAISRGIEANTEQVRATVQSLAETGSRLIVSALRVLLPRMASRFALDEVAGLLALLTDVLRAESGAVVAIAPTTAAALEVELTRLGETLPDGLHLRQDSAMAVGDIAVTWEGGAVRRDTGALLQRLETMLTENGP